MQGDVPTRPMIHGLLKKAQLWNTALPRQTLTAQRRCKGDLGKNVRQGQTFEVVDLEFVYHPPHSTIESNAADEMANHQYKKSFWRKSGPYRVLSIHSQAITVKQDSILDSLSMDSLTVSPTIAPVATTPYRIIVPVHKSQKVQNVFQAARKAKRNLKDRRWY